MTSPSEVTLLESIEKAKERALGTLSVLKEQARVALPLARVGIEARVAGCVAQVTMLQTFRNPNTQPMEAVYIFPLPGGCAVSDFEMRVADRVIKGRIEERAKARETYKKAIEKGQRAALLEMERDDVFTAQVGNIPPGEEITVKIVTSEHLAFFEDGTTEIRLPLVVAPRYVPGAPLDGDSVGDGTSPDTDAVPDASRITPPLLVPGFDPQTALDLSVTIEGPGTGDIACSQHATRFSPGPDSVRVSLARKDELLNRDFILRWRRTADALQSRLLVHGEDGNRYGMLTILPPRVERFVGRARDVVFVLDRSGSMMEAKMASAARACSILLSTLGPRDRYAILAFDDVREWLPGGFRVADTSGISEGDRFLRGIGARGGTEMLEALRDALRVVGERGDAADRETVLLFITDGQVGDEHRILKHVQEHGKGVRIFTVGVDTAVNEGFLKRLAAQGRGTASYVAPGEELESALQGIGREIGTPFVTDLRILDDGGIVETDSRAPERMPDLFIGRAATVFFRMKGTGMVRVGGLQADGSAFETKVEATPIDMPAIAHLWARARIADLEDRYRITGGRPESGSRESIEKQIVEIAVRHRVLSRFTSFIVVDEKEIVNPDGTVQRIVQPVHVPHMWDMLKESEGVTVDACFVMRGISRAISPLTKARSSRRHVAGAGETDGLSRPDVIPPPIMERLLEEYQREVASHIAKRRRIASLFRAFLRAFFEAKRKIEAGETPGVGKLEEAAAELAKVIKDDWSLAQLRFFLDYEIPQLIRALKALPPKMPNAPEEEAPDLFGQLEAQLRTITQESDLEIPDASDRKFWGKTV